MPSMKDWDNKKVEVLINDPNFLRERIYILEDELKCLKKKLETIHDLVVMQHSNVCRKIHDLCHLVSNHVKI